LHLITILKQTLVCISPVLGFSLLAYLTIILTVHYIFLIAVTVDQLNHGFLAGSGD